ncbi:hypothetical protein FWP36_23275 [Vibrio parahaemolyticus]|nr:hypothetical protein [Vibrio parahaemolyticus]EGQ9712485.1 hypothetical protein [Vibrio parahaemolyticus]EGQ9799240.1 hypothetical protein [Vibrio parahaemolyticus]EGR1752964.1 hypothetical protein [Vibrio parahaemolyticus]
MKESKEKFNQVLASLNQQCLTLNAIYRRRTLNNQVNKKFAHPPKCVTSCVKLQDDSGEN